MFKNKAHQETFGLLLLVWKSIVTYSVRDDERVAIESVNLLTSIADVHVQSINELRLMKLQ